MTDFPDLFLAESMEATPNLPDRSGITPPPTSPCTHTLVVEGVFSTYANAEAALDMRNARFRDAVPAEQFQSYGDRMWKRDMSSPWEGATPWQTITRIRVDRHTS